MSTLFVRTLRENPSDAEVPSHQLLLRAGYIRRAAPGGFTWLPLGWAVYRNVERIVREEMDGAGFQEVHFPALLPREPYEATNRWTEYGDNLFRLKDRRGADFLLGPTHEEMFTLLVKDLYSSYRDLPLVIYQIQTKYRDEARPRAGLLRGREFVMKDSYSFDVDDDGLARSYEAHRLAGRLHEALRGAYHDFLYTNNPRSRLASISIVWDMAVLLADAPGEEDKATAFLLFAALNLPPVYQEEAQVRLASSPHEMAKQLASHDGWHYLRTFRQASKRFFGETLRSCADVLWLRAHPKSAFVEWVLHPYTNKDEPEPAPAPAATGAGVLLDNPLSALHHAFATHRHYDLEAVELFRRIGLGYTASLAPGTASQATRYLRQAVWGAYRAHLVDPGRASESLVEAVGALMHGHVVDLHRRYYAQQEEKQQEQENAKAYASLARTILVGCRRLYRLSPQPRFLLFQAYAESFAKPDDALGTYLQYFQNGSLEGAWRWLEKEVWERVQSRDIFFL